MDPIDRLLQTVALDEAHRVERPPVAVTAEAVDREDARVFQAAGDLGLEQKPGAGFRAVNVRFLDFLERDLPVQLLVERDGYLAEAAGSVRAENDEAARGLVGERNGRVRVAL